MPATIKKAYFSHPSGQIHYRHTTLPATQAIPLLILHISASSSASCAPLMAHFSALGHACFAPDMPGFGQSFDPTTDPASLAWYARLYLDVFSSLPEFAAGCHVLGHHSGAPLGVEMAVLQPSFVKSLAMLGPVVLPPAARQAALADAAFNEPVADGSHLIKTWEYLQQPGRIPSGETELALLQRETLDHARAWRGRLQIYKCVFAHDGDLMLPRVGCPVLALCARDDVLWPHFGRVREVKGDVVVEEVEGGVFALERGVGSVAAAVERFLKGLKDGSASGER